MKEEAKTPEEELSDVKISNLLDKEFKVMIVKVLIELKRKMEEHSENENFSH